MTPDVTLTPDVHVGQPKEEGVYDKPKVCIANMYFHCYVDCICSSYCIGAAGGTC